MLRYVPLLISMLVSGCFLLPADEEPDDSRGGFHDVTLTWRLMNLDGTVMSACPPGYTTIVAHLYELGLVEPPDALVKAPCTPQGSLTQPVATSGKLADPETLDLELRAYYPYTPTKDIWIDVTEETQTAYAATSFVYYVDNLSSDTTISFDLYPAGGMGVLAWQLASSLTSAPLTSCATAGVDQIEVAVRPYADDTAPLQVVGTWPCTQVDPYVYYDPDANTVLMDEDYELGSGHTSGIAAGEYFAELRAKRGGAIVGTTESSLRLEDKSSVHRFHDASIPISDR